MEAMDINNAGPEGDLSNTLIVKVFWRYHYISKIAIIVSGWQWQIGFLLLFIMLERKNSDAHNTLGFTESLNLKNPLLAETLLQCPVFTIKAWRMTSFEIVNKKKKGGDKENRSVDHSGKL